MIQGRCPICRKRFEVASLADAPKFPFCSDRCRLVDLGRWIDGSYAIPGSPQTPKEGAEGKDEDEDE